MGLIETTNEITYGLPIMVTLLAAKFVGDLFNIGLYDIHNEMKGIPFLEWDAPEGMESLEARDIMTSKLLCVLPHSTVEQVIAVLKDASMHNGFPVITPDSVRPQSEEVPVIDELKGGVKENIRFRGASVMDSRADGNTKSGGVGGTFDESQYLGLPGTDDPQLIKERYNDISANPTDTINGSYRFHGIITRAQLITLLKNRVWYKDNPAQQKELDHWQMIEDYPRYPSIDDLILDDVTSNAIMDLTPYMKASPYSISPHLVAPKVFQFFRTMGLRHLPVVNSMGEIVGIITRNDLTHQAMMHTLAEKVSNIATSPH